MSIKANDYARSVFINVPFDKQYKPLFIALVSGLVGLGLMPRSSLEVPPSQRRLNRIYQILKSCAFSVHDLSRIQVHRQGPRVPRFNMPFEAGLAVARELNCERHQLFLMEAVPHRIEKSCNDLNAYDAQIHYNKVKGMFAVVTNFFSRRDNSPNVDDLMRIYRCIRPIARRLQRDYKDFYTRAPYLKLVMATQEIIAKSFTLK